MVRIFLVVEPLPLDHQGAEAQFSEEQLGLEIGLSHVRDEPDAPLGRELLFQPVNERGPDALALPFGTGPRD